MTAFRDLNTATMPGYGDPETWGGRTPYGEPPAKRCGVVWPAGHVCSCDIPADEHDPGWHECGDCGREWHDDDFNFKAAPA